MNQQLNRDKENSSYERTLSLKQGLKKFTEKWLHVALNVMK